MDELPTLRNDVPPENGIYKTRDGKWFVRFDNASHGAEVPAEIARNMRVGLRIERMSQHGSNPKISALRKSIVCHQAALYAIGLVKADDIAEDGFVLPAFEQSEFTSFGTEEELAAYLKSKTKGAMGLAQVVVGTDIHDLQHSFLFGFDELGRVVCAEKQDYDKPFRVVSLSEIYNQYRRGFWAAGSIDAVRNSAAAQEIRSRLEGRKSRQNIQES